MTQNLKLLKVNDELKSPSLKKLIEIQNQLHKVIKNYEINNELLYPELYDIEMEDFCLYRFIDVPEKLIGLKAMHLKQKLEMHNYHFQECDVTKKIGHKLNAISMKYPELFNRFNYWVDRGGD